MKNETFNLGDIVKFSNPCDEQEAQILFQVREDRGSRVLVHSLMVQFQGWAIIPTMVYSKSDLELVRAA